ncbi:MAG: SDR family oxidoreductase [Ruminococcaceae bacterium]|nr:SDR family oxidoreductase [Oscillospiraceae bacterium]
MKDKIVLLTGGSSGIGKAAVQALLDKGCTVYSCSRRPCDLPGVHHIPADVTDTASVTAAAETVMREQGHIDVLINCAGSGISGAVEFTEADQVKWQMDVNFMGTVNMTKAVLPHMREAGGGRIVNISSVAASFPIPFQTYYSASKAAVNAYTCALANEVRPFGITVTAIQPGDIRTGFTAARVKTCTGDDVYNGRISRSVAVMEKDEQNGMDPEIAGRWIAKIALSGSGKPIHTLGFGYKCLCFLQKILPWSLVNRLIGMIYAK